MVCEKCIKKQDKVGAPDVWRDGSRNRVGGKDGGIKVAENKYLEKRKAQLFEPYAAKCKECNKSVTQKLIYCQMCAYKKGLCAMCGIKVMNTKSYKQTNV